MVQFFSLNTDNVAATYNRTHVQPVFYFLKTQICMKQNKLIHNIETGMEAICILLLMHSSELELNGVFLSSNANYKFDIVPFG